MSSSTVIVNDAIQMQFIKQQPISMTFAYHVQLMCVHSELRSGHGGALPLRKMRYLNAIIIIITHNNGDIIFTITTFVFEWHQKRQNNIAHFQNT